MVRCKLCNKNFFVISNTHLKAQHRLTIKQYTSRFGNKGIGFTRSISDLSKNDPRYIQWRKSLLQRPPPWSKGYTKETHPSVAKISSTFKKKKIDNFAVWRKEARKRGQIPTEYPALKKNNDLAFLIGMVLGDGNIFCFERTEGLRITLGTDKPDLWKYTAEIVEKVFKKKPAVNKVKNSACMIITLYQKDISKRLGVSTGARGDTKIKVPKWILDDKKYIIRYLRGLYEAEGSFCTHRPTYTYKFLFSNRNISLLNIVYRLLRKLDFHPHKSKNQIQISKRDEVYKIKELLQFRSY